MPNQNKTKFKFSNSISIKLLVIFVLILLLQIPLAFVQNLIYERQQLQSVAQSEIQKRWGEQQYVGSPSIITTRQTHDKLNNSVSKSFSIPANSLNLKADIQAQVRYLGIYESAIYNSDLQLSGQFKLNSVATQNLITNATAVKLFVPLREMTGLKEIKSIKINAQSYPFEPELSVSNGIYGFEIDLQNVSLTERLNYDFEFSLSGSKELNILPQAKKNNISMHSNWASPAFIGNHLPDTRTITNEGFDASWTINNLVMVNKTTDQDYQSDGVFGVEIKIPANIYQVNYRTVKYSFLIIVLTFCSFFLTELFFKLKLHPFQYLLIGVSLSVFYLLLLSLSEYLQFNTAFLISSVAVITLVSGYSSVILQQRKRGLLTGLLFTVLYGFIFVLVKAEQTSLLMGSIAIWIFLALVMYLTRKINWYAINS